MSPVVRPSRLFAALILGAAVAAVLPDAHAQNPPAKKVGAELKHGDWVRGVSFSPDGKLVATGCGDNSARIWEVPSGKLEKTFKHKDAVWCVAFSPDGKFLATGTGTADGAKADRGAGHLWDVAAAKQPHPPLQHDDGVYAIGFVADGKTLFTGGVDGAVKLWDVATGKQQGKTIKFETSVWCGAACPNGKMFAVCTTEDHLVRVFDAAGNPVGKAKTAHGGQGVSFTPDGKLLAVASGFITEKKGNAPAKQGGEVAVFEVPSGKPAGKDLPVLKPVGKPVAFDHLVHEVAFTPDGKHLLVGAFDHEVHLLEVPSGKKVGPAMKHGSNVLALGISPDGKTFAVGGTADTAHLWRLDK